MRYHSFAPKMIRWFKKSRRIHNTEVAVNRLERMTTEELHAVFVEYHSAI